MSRIVECDQYLPERDTVEMFPAHESIILTVQTAEAPQQLADTTNYINYRQTGLRLGFGLPPLSIFAELRRAFRHWLTFHGQASSICKKFVAFHLIPLDILLPEVFLPLYKYKIILELHHEL